MFFCSEWAVRSWSRSVDSWLIMTSNWSSFSARLSWVPAKKQVAVGQGFGEGEEHHHRHHQLGAGGRCTARERLILGVGHKDPHGLNHPLCAVKRQAFIRDAPPPKKKKIKLMFWLNKNTNPN